MRIIYCQKKSIHIADKILYDMQNVLCIIRFKQEYKNEELLCYLLTDDNPQTFIVSPSEFLKVNGYLYDLLTL